MTWVESHRSETGEVEVEDLDGVSWAEAPIPSRLHCCTPQTRGWVQTFTRVYRCRCGAISRDGRHWIERNSRRTSRS